MDKINLYTDWDSNLISHRVKEGLLRNEKNKVNSPELSRAIYKLTGTELKDLIGSIVSGAWLVIHDL